MREHQQGRQGGGKQSSDHHHGERALNLGTGPGGKHERDQAEHGNRRRHQNGPQPQGASATRSRAHVAAFAAQLQNAGNQYQAVENSNAEEGNESDRSRH